MGQRNKSNSYPLKLINLVSERTHQIAENPFIYKSTDFKDVRKASMGNFTIYFKIADKQIIVFGFWDNRQDPKKLIDFLKNRA